MKIILITPLLLSLMIAGCGGSGGKSSNNSSTPSANTPPPTASSTPVAVSSAAPASSQAASSTAPLLTGVFLDAAVMNIGYRTASQQGFTNANGEFSYRPGETITFFIGNLEFPPVLAGDIVTPMDIANTNDLANNQLINILRLLQSLDADGDLTNGIGISAAALAAGVTLDFSLPPEVFAQLPAVQELLQAAGGVNTQLVSADQAVAHFQTTLEFINGPASSSSSSDSSTPPVVASSVPASSAASSLTPASSLAASSAPDLSPSPVPTSSAAASSLASSAPVLASSSVPAVVSSSAASVPAVASSSADASSVADSSSSAANSSAVVETSSAAQNSSADAGENSSSSTESSASSAAPAVVVRPAKMEGFAAHAGVTGGVGGAEVTVTTGTELNAALCSRASMTTPIVIKVNGTINHGNTTAQGCNTQADVIEVKKMSNVSIIGVGSNALFDEIGIHVREASNVIIQNVHVRNVKKSGSPISNGGDAIGMESSVDRVWIDHNWLEASGGEKDGYDSLIDMKSGVTNVTVSYNLFNDSSRAGLVGFTDSDTNNNITFHHNWYKNIQQRTPLIRNALVHVYNNYWSNETIDYMFHAINSRANATALVESNYFYNVNNPLIASDDSSTPGCWQTNNDNTVLPEIYYSRTVGNGALVVPEVVDGQLQSTCAVTVPYSVEMDAAADVPAIVMANVGVGKIDGGSATSSSTGSATTSSVANSSAANSAGASSTAVSSSAAASSVAASSVAAGAGVALNEAFNVDKTTLFSAAHQAISTDSSAALYYITGGGSGITIANNELTLAGGRLTIGNRPPRTSTTAGDSNANGDFDLTRPYRISFTVVAGSGSGKFQVYVDNNTTSSGNSIHGADSKVFEAVASSLTGGQQVVITPTVGTSTSFIALRTESSATVTIDNLLVEYTDVVASSSASSTEASASSAESSVASSEVNSSAESSSVAASSAPASSVEASSSVQSSSVQSSDAQSSAVASSEPASSEASSSAGSVSGVFINESFDVDKTALFSAEYHAISTDSTAALYFITGGSSGITISNNELSLAGARLTIGHRPPRTNTTSGDSSANGDFDLSRPYRISFKVVAASGSGKVQVYIDNSTTSSGNSIHGANSKVFEAVASSLTAGQQVEITPAVGTSTSFIALRTESSATVVIDDLVIEYTDGLGASSSSAAGAGQSSAATSSSANLSSAQSSSVATSASSRSSVAYIPPSVSLSADCISLATNPSVNWRDTSLQTDQEIVECLSQSLGKPVGYGEKALGGFDPNGTSKLTIITKTGGVSVEQQLIDALTDNAHNWIVFDKAEFAQAHEIGMYRQYCADATTLSVLGTTEAECRDYRSWCAGKGFNDEATCRTEFFNKTMNKSNIPIRIPAIGSNKTLDGRGSEAYFIFSGFAIGKDSDGVPTQTSESVILTHLKFQGAGHTEDHYVDPDMIRSTGASHDIWIHKNTFDTTGDSAFDVKIGANAITMSFNRLQNVKRAVLHGSSDSRTINANITTTMHHNAFVTTDDSYMLLGNTLRRVPLLRRGKTHMFNNVFVNYRKEVLSLRVGASAFLEDNAFVVNSSLQEKSSVEASLAEISNNYFKDISGGSLRNDRNFLWFGSGTCVVNDATKTALTATNGAVADLSENYNAASLNMFNGWRFAAGQDLVDYVTLTAGKYGDAPFNSPLSADRTYMEALIPVSCQ